MKTQEDRNRELEWRREDREIRKEDDAEDREIRRGERAVDRKEDIVVYVKHAAIGVGVMVALMMIAAIPMKAIDWSNCTDACEANGHKPFWQISLGCLCDDGDGLYNPKDER